MGGMRFYYCDFLQSEVSQCGFCRQSHENNLVLYLFLLKLSTMNENILSRPKLTVEFLRNNRGYFYVLALIIGACFTDSPSGKEQVTIALPLMLAFEWTILLMDRFRK